MNPPRSPRRVRLERLRADLPNTDLIAVAELAAFTQLALFDQLEPAAPRARTYTRRAPAPTKAGGYVPGTTPRPAPLAQRKAEVARRIHDELVAIRRARGLDYEPTASRADIAAFGRSASPADKAAGWPQEEDPHGEAEATAG